MPKQTTKTMAAHLEAAKLDLFDLKTVIYSLLLKVQFWNKIVQIEKGFKIFSGNKYIFGNFL